MNISKEEKVKWILENCVDKNGNIDLYELDFSNFKGNINISKMKVNGSLLQNKQEVQDILFQDCQKVNGTLYQCCQNVQGNLLQGYQMVQGDFITQTLEEDEKYEIKDGVTYIVKKRKKLTQEEIEELLGYEIELM